MNRQFVLQGVTNNESSVVLGVYSTYEKMEEALRTWRENEVDLKHYFYDVKEVDDAATWTNQQQGIK